MSEHIENYYALRFRSADELHRKGDVQYVTDRALYVGQTEECGLRIAENPDFADCCYAALVKNDDGRGWRIIRQERYADVTVNGEPLALVRNLKNGDLLKFDRTLVQFTVEQGDRPMVQYVQSKPAWGLWAAMAGVVIALFGVIAFLYLNNQKPTAIFKREIPSICKIEADTLLVLTSQDTLEIPADRSMVGTGFIVDNGYFVTARHCVEFWLAMEDELKSNLRDIHSQIVRWAIGAEMDTNIRLVAKLKVTSHDGKQVWYFTSEDFLMDKTLDNVYEFGDFETPYLWRSLVSLYERRGTELGDVAVMRWPFSQGTIKLADPDLCLQEKSDIFCFGYPQSDSRQEAVFSTMESSVYQGQTSSYDFFICEKGLDPGFSGGPVFIGGGTNAEMVVGIVSRSDGNHTLMVPVSQIHKLIRRIEQQ